MNERELAALANFAYEMGLLKRAKRTGWWLAGISDPESIAEHSFRTAIIGMLLALMAGADVGRTVMLCLLHDSQESRIGDVPSVGRPYVTTAPHPAVTADQVADFPDKLGRAIREVVDEYEARESPEALLARDADKLECLAQAREYQALGNQSVQPWIDSSVAALRTPAARQLADACLRVPPGQWWQSFSDAYRTHIAAPPTTEQP